MKNRYLHITISSIVEIRKYWRIIVFVYGVEFMASFALAWMGSKWIESAIGHSASFQNLLEGWDQIVISDLFASHGIGGELWFNMFVITTLLVFLIKYAWNAGMFYAFSNSAPRLHSFFQGIFRHFLPIFLVAVPFIIASGIIMLVTLLLVGIIFKNTPWENEHFFWQVIFSLIAFGIFLVTWVRSWSLFVQDNMLNYGGDPLLVRFRNSLSLKFKPVWWVFAIRSISLIVLVLVFYLLARLELWLGVNSILKVLLFFLLYQGIQIIKHSVTLAIRNMVHNLNLPGNLK